MSENGIETLVLARICMVYSRLASSCLSRQTRREPDFRETTVEARIGEAITPRVVVAQPEEALSHASWTTRSD